MSKRLFSRAILGVAAILSACALVSCTSGGSDSESRSDTVQTPATSAQTQESTDAAQPSAESMDLDVLVYNVEYGGDASTDRVMRSLDADIVGVLESYNRLPEIAEKTGYPYYNVGLQLLSKYPILEPSGADGLYALIEVQPGYAVAMFNTHLDYVAYGPRLLAQGMDVADVVASEEEVRSSSLRFQLPHLETLADSGYPVFFTGDFNEPSSLDYTEETIGTRPGVDEVVPWPVSESLLDIGFRDTFREAHPDPVSNPGLTHDNPDFRQGGAGDRIDYVYAGGPVEIADSQLVGETGDANVDIGFGRWTSDHRAVMTTVNVVPVPLPETVALDRRMLTEGDDLTVYYNAPATPVSSIALVPAKAGAADAIETQETQDASGMLMFETDALDPAGYDVVMVGSDGSELQRNQFWVRSKSADVQIATDRDTYHVGQPIKVSWEDGPANRWDWVSVYKASAANPHKDDYLVWGYTGGHDSGALPPSVSGEMVFDGSSQGRPWPLPPGDYVVHYLLTDQYNSAGSTHFTVVG